MNLPRKTKEGWYRENNFLAEEYESFLTIMVPLMANYDLQVIHFVLSEQKI